MAKETMSERNSNPEYFEVIECEAEGCKSTHGLLKHRYSETYMCLDCVNALATKIREEKEREDEELFGNEGYYTEMSYNQLLQERNA